MVVTVNQSLITPTALRPGDLIGIFSPSDPLTIERQHRMQPSLDLLARNFRYRFAQNAFAQTHYTAGTVQQRIADLDELVADPETKALLASKGGKNANQLVGSLPFESIATARKPIVGFSDGCVLLNSITAQTGLITFYGPNNADRLFESDHWDFSLLQGKAIPPFGLTAHQEWTTLIPGKATGRLFGGNLSTFVLSCAGSEAMANMDDVIFFWESGSKTPQLVDQYLACLVNCGFFTKVRAMVVGDTTYQEKADKDRPMNEVLTSYGRRFGFPLVRIENFGHRKLENPSIPIGAQVSLDTEIQSITLEHEVVDYGSRGDC